MLPAIAGVVSVAVILTRVLLQRSHQFVPGACGHLENYLASHIVGQDLALSQLSDAICDHLAPVQRQPAAMHGHRRPLVLSAHGPPGVGKSMTHALAARALYGRDPDQHFDCPGQDCPGYKVFYGMDYMAAERETQHTRLLQSIVQHLKDFPDALLVIEEYDKLSCEARGALRQLLEGSADAAGAARPIVMLESNAGYQQLHEMLVRAGHRSQIQPEAAQALLKDLIFELWTREECEDKADTLKSLGLITFFLPYLPLERSHLARLFEQHLAVRGQALLASPEPLHANLTWGPDVIEFMLERVDFGGSPHPIEGAKEVAMLMTRYISRTLRGWAALRKQQHPVQVPGKQAAQQPPAPLHLHVGRDGRSLALTEL